SRTNSGEKLRAESNVEAQWRIDSERDTTAIRTADRALMPREHILHRFQLNSANAHVAEQFTGPWTRELRSQVRRYPPSIFAELRHNWQRARCMLSPRRSRRPECAPGAGRGRRRGTFAFESP